MGSPRKSTSNQIQTQNNRQGEQMIDDDDMMTKSSQFYDTQ